LVDYPVAYTQYGYDECVAIDPSLKDRLKIINHGVDTNVFKPVDKAIVDKFRHIYFESQADDKFLITNVNRNQARKDTARTLQAFSILKKQVPEAMLYMHMKFDDVAYDLREVARAYDLQMGVDFMVPKDFSEHDGISVEMVNLIYNASDCIISTTLGEGWGLSSTEAMATKTPAVFPNNTSLKEIFADGRGLLVECGRTINDWFVLSQDNERLRPLTNVVDMVTKIKWLRDNKDSKEVKDMIEKAYSHTLSTWDWSIIGEQWRSLFRDILATREAKIGRNSPCPECLKIGKSIKYKNCTEHGRR
jgi:glycosyltransferase involved in cell wall biosynthesis